MKNLLVRDNLTSNININFDYNYFINSNSLLEITRILHNTLTNELNNELNNELEWILYLK